MVGFGGSFQRFHLISFCFLFDFFLISCNLCRLHFPPTLGNTRCAGRDITEQPEPTARHATKSLAEILVVVQLAISDAKQPLSNGGVLKWGYPQMNVLYWKTPLKWMILLDMDVSINGGTPISSIFNRIFPSKQSSY